jgi:succinate-semialdehyde dehydrogenase/glutarate-semialdehyde dehydrogenase/succinyl-CoA reductase
MKFQSINPITEEVLEEFEISDKKTVSKTVKEAKIAFNDWKKSDISEREKIIRKFSDILKKNKNEVAELISKEMGKPIIESEGEIEGSFANIDWFISNTGKILQDEEVKLDAENATAKVMFEPVGVVGLITPWNFPIDTPLWKTIPALLTGNTIVFKPSELSTLCGLKIGELLKEAGIPENMFNTITGDGITGRYLVSSKVNMISFTGSSKAGKDVLSRAGKGLKKTVLELGGSDPFIVFEDAILEQAVNAAVYGRFLNCGQVCTAAKRIFVEKKIYDSFLDSFVEKVRKLKVGNPLDRSTEIGPIVSKKQLENLERQVKDAIDNGAKVLCGGKRIKEKGYFYEPTVLTNIKKNMFVLNEEVFGPVASVLSFKSIKEVIKLANNTKYGLGASFWTQGDKTAEEMIKSIESGMIWINDFGMSYPQCPQGGIKESGIGKELSRYGVLEFCNMKTVVNSKDKTIKKPWWFPYNGD